MSENKVREAIINIDHAKYDSAMNSCIEALKLNIFNSDAYYVMGRLCEHKKDYNKAFLLYEQAEFLNDGKDNNIEISELKEDDNNYQTVDINDLSIIVFNYNQKEYLKLCLESIKRYCNNNIEVIVVDNKSDDGSAEWLSEQDDIKAVLCKDKKSFSELVKVGVNQTHSNNDILLLNGPCILMPNSVLNMRIALYSENILGAVGAVTNKIDNNDQKVFVKANSFREYMDFAKQNNCEASKSLYKEYVSDFAIMIKRKAFNHLELDSINDDNYSEYKLSVEVGRRGYRVMVSNNSYIHRV